MRLENGRNYTGRAFNDHLKKVFSPYLDFDKGKVLSHSFRAGLATMMAQCNYTDEEIMATGEYLLSWVVLKSDVEADHGSSLIIILEIMICQ